MAICATSLEMLMALDDTGIGGWWLVTARWLVASDWWTL
jgi:hypothetical protein